VLSLNIGCRNLHTVLLLAIIVFQDFIEQKHYAKPFKIVVIMMLYSVPVVIVVMRPVRIMSARLPFIIVMTVVVAVLFNPVLFNSVLFNPMLLNSMLAVNFVQLAMSSMLMLAALSFFGTPFMDSLVKLKVLMVAKFFVAIFIAMRPVRICQYCNRKGQQSKA
jgi:hypothetical protein